MEEELGPRGPAASGGSESTRRWTPTSSTRPSRPRARCSPNRTTLPRPWSPSSPRAGPYGLWRGRRASSTCRSTPGGSPGAPSSPSCSPRLSRKTSPPRAPTYPTSSHFHFQDEYYEIHNYDFVERGRSRSRTPWPSRTTRSSSSSPPTWAWKTWSRRPKTSASRARSSPTPRRP